MVLNLLFFWLEMSYISQSSSDSSRLAHSPGNKFKSSTPPPRPPTTTHTHRAFLRFLLFRGAGVGGYTSAAIASIACGEAVAVVDANVIRVVARLRKLSGDPKASASVKLHGVLANAIVDPDRPGDFNQACSTPISSSNSSNPVVLLMNHLDFWQAMMELGATVCTSQPPDCKGCPINQYCWAYADVTAHKSEGGDPAAVPLVTQYPRKVGHNHCFMHKCC